MGYGNFSNNPHDASNPLTEKTGRVREVFDTDMVIHVWASNNQARGRNAKGSCYFEHGTLYSYGSHYVMAHHMPGGVVLLNDDSNSVTTNRHRSDARHAASHLTCYRLPNLTSLLPSYYAPLRMIVQSERSAEDKARGKSAILDYVAKHALGLTDDAGAYLLGLTGLAPSKAATRLSALRNAATKAAAKQAAADKVTAERNAVRRAKQYANLSDRAWRRELGEAYAPRLESWLKDMRRYNAALKRSGATRMAASLAVRLKAAASDHAAAKRSLNRANANRSRLACVSAIRGFVAALEVGREPADSYWNWRNLVGAFGGVRKTTPRLAELAALAETMQDAWNDAAAAREAAAREERRRVAAMKEEERRAAWFAGTLAQGLWHGTDENHGAMLRVVGDELQTSQGASVPLAHAIRAFRFIKLCRNRGAEWTRNGRVIRVGHFTVDRIDIDGSFRAGCHRINWPEIERIARAIGVYDAEPDSAALEPSHAAA